MKLLIIDSDPLTLKSLEIMLAKERDITVLGLADDVIKALDICHSNEPTGILMAICTNNINGIKLIKAYYPNVKIILLVNFAANAHTGEQVLRLGADGYLEKTDDIHLIIEKLRKMILDSNVLNGKIEK